MVDKFGFQEIQSWEPISVIKDRVLDHTLFFGALLALLAFIISSFVSPTYAFSPGFYLDIGSLSGLFIVYAFRKKLNLRFKLGCVILFVYFLFITSITQYGTVSTQLSLVVLIPFLCTIAFSSRVTIIVFMGIVVSFTVVAYLFVSNSIESRIPNPLNSLPTLWTTTGIILLVVTSLIILVMNRFNHEMNLIIKKLKKRDNELVGHLEEKNVMLQEIHHRVKNNLAVVSGLLELQMMNIENPDQKKMMQKSVNRILSIGKVHEMLYQSESYNRIPFKNYVDELAYMILKSMNSERLDINFESHIEPEFLSISKGIPLGIIFNELITNSIKYGFKPERSNLIKIHIHIKEGFIHTTYEDNGVGIDNFEEAYTKSLGFSLIESLLSQIHADYSYRTDDGFKLTFSFLPESK